MGKDGFMTPKAIANRIKAKGLQKLRWYCQMCQKQCRDENGFKCHCSSESHIRQMQIFGSKPGKFLDEFSREFRDTFLRQLKHSHGTKRTFANAVYNEYIKDRHHTHMNATKWSSLSGFCQHLARAGFCTIDETPKGWYIAYIDKDPATLEKQKRKERREKSDISEEERERKRIEKQLKKAQREAEGKDDQSAPTELQKQGDEKVTFSLFSKAKKEEGPEKEAGPEKDNQHEDDESSEKGHQREKEADEKEKEEEEVIFAVPQKRKREEKEEEEKEEKRDDRHHRSSTTSRSHDHRKDGRDGHHGSSRDDRDRSRWDRRESDSKRRRTDDQPSSSSSRPKNAMEEIMQMEEQKKERLNRLDYWVTPGVVVKVKHKTLANGKYYNEKGVVQEVEARYVAHVKMLTSGDLLKIDQEMLETVLPALGGRVRIVNGAYRGSTAVLKEINVDKFCATIVIDKGPQSGRELVGVEYEDVCKIADAK